MPKLMEKCRSDVKKFNEEVTNLVDSLATCQQEPRPELIYDLFKGYCKAADCDFAKYMKCKEEEFLETRYAGAANVLMYPRSCKWQTGSTSSSRTKASGVLP
jgi:hypothetical protein